MKNNLANVFQLASLGSITFGAFELSTWVGLIILGLCLGLIGYALDKGDDA